MQSILSKREEQITRLVAVGQTAKEIGGKLFISTRTVETHIKNAKIKTKAKSMAHLVAIFLQSLVRDGKTLLSMIFLLIHISLVVPNTKADVRRARRVRTSRREVCNA